MGKRKAEHYASARLLYWSVVGAEWFEHSTSCSQGRRANQAALRPDYIEKGSILGNRASEFWLPFVDALKKQFASPTKDTIYTILIGESQVKDGLLSFQR